MWKKVLQDNNSCKATLGMFVAKEIGGTLYQVKRFEQHDLFGYCAVLQPVNGSDQLYYPMDRWFTLSEWEEEKV